MYTLPKNRGACVDTQKMHLQKLLCPPDGVPTLTGRVGKSLDGVPTPGVKRGGVPTPESGEAEFRPLESGEAEFRPLGSGEAEF